MAAITELRREYELAALLEFAGIPRSTYYYHCKKAQSKDKYQLEKAEIAVIYQENQGAMATAGFYWNCVIVDMA